MVEKWQRETAVSAQWRELQFGVNARSLTTERKTADAKGEWTAPGQHDFTTAAEMV